MMRGRKRLAIAAGAGLLSALFLTVSLALAALPRLSTEERLVVRALEVLAERREVSTSVTTLRHSFRAGCRVVSRTEELVTTAGGRRFVLAGRQPVTREGFPLPVSLRRDAFLAGCPRLLVTSVGRRLRGGRPAYGRVTIVSGRPAHELHAGSAGEIHLLVDASSLEPLAIRIGRNAVSSYRP